MNVGIVGVIEPIAGATPIRRSKAVGGTETTVGGLRPKRARITGADG